MLQIVRSAEKHGTRLTGHKCDVNEQCSKEWCKKIKG